MKRLHWVLLGCAGFILLLFGPPDLSNFIFKGLVPVWLLVLYPIAIYLIFRTYDKVRRIWRKPAEETAFAFLPQGLQANPIKCHRYFIAVLAGLACLTWSALVIPLWVEPFNEIGRIENKPFGSKPPWAPIVHGIALSTGITFYLGITILVTAYFGAWRTSLKVRRDQAEM